MKKDGIRNIIFDLGGVIIGLDTTRTLTQMGELLGLSNEKMRTLFQRDDRFKTYETGDLSDTEFRDFIRSFSREDIIDSAIDRAWNAMILDIAPERLSLLKTLKSNYTLYLLSNTNGIHLEYINTKFPLYGVTSFEDIFDKEYYSHKVGLRKPNTDIFEYVLEDQNMDPSETLFFDDNEENIEGAKSLGIQTFLAKDIADKITYFHAK